jgi:NADH:ubiquinone oxidoreductase subunit 4 (subunit M)
MIQKVTFGEVQTKTKEFKDISINEWVALCVVAIVILVLGFYPDLIIHLLRTEVV